MQKIMGWLWYNLVRAFKKLRFSAIYKSDIHATSKIEGGCQIVDVTMGRHSFCGYDCTLLHANIGAFCSIADNVYIGGSGHPVHFVSTSPVFLSHRDSVRAKFSMHQFEDLPTSVVGNDVWIGYGARIKAGVNIGHGAVVGMGSVVTKDVAPYAIVAGNPARVIRMRFSEEFVAALLREEWWNYTDDDLRKFAPYFHAPEEFLKQRGLR